MFVINHRELPESLTCIVSADGELYLRSVDVGRNLGYKNPYSFAARHHQFRVDEILHKNIRLSPSLAKTRVMALDLASEHLRPCIDQHKFLSMFSRGHVSGSPEPTLYARRAGILCMDESSCITFNQFFEEFCEKALQLYERLIDVPHYSDAWDEDSFVYSKDEILREMYALGDEVEIVEEKPAPSTIEPPMCISVTMSDGNIYSYYRR